MGESSLFIETGNRGQGPGMEGGNNKDGMMGRTLILQNFVTKEKKGQVSQNIKTQGKPGKVSPG